MADTNNPYFPSDVVSPEEELRKNQIGLVQIKSMLSSLKVGSADYNKYKAALDATTARIKELNDITNATRTTVKAKETTSKRQKLVDDVTRANDYGTAAEKTKAQAALDTFDGKQSPSNKPGTGSVKYAGDGSLASPLTADGKAFTGTKDGKDYNNGIVLAPKGNAPVAKNPVAKTPSTIVDSTNSDPKGIWVDALKATFKTGIDDPAQKAQIDNLISQAKAGGWKEATFMEALKNTTWWSQTLPTLRQFFLDTHDPRQAATQAQTMLNKIDTIQAKMEMLGIKVNDIDPVTGKVIDNRAAIKELAAQSLQNGWDDNQLAQHLAAKSDIIFTGGGQLGGYVDQIKRQALNYGVALDNNQLTTIQRDLLNPQDGKDAQWYLNNIKQQSIDANPAFAASLKEGRSLYDVTSSYRNQMSSLLEVDPTNITWNDLMNKVMNKDKGTANTFADFTKLVKQDPLWQTTKNAKETYSNTALDLMKQFGFMG
jgi:hypothetical protein